MKTLWATVIGVVICIFFLGIITAKEQSKHLVPADKGLSPDKVKGLIKRGSE